MEVFDTRSPEEVEKCGMPETKIPVFLSVEPFVPE